MTKIYIGKSDYNEQTLKIGYTDQSCWARCKKADYTIFAAVAFNDLTDAETRFIESYVRLAFNAMTETLGQNRIDYFVMRREFIFTFPNNADTTVKNIESWGYAWLYQFVQEAVDIINSKRAFSKTAPILQMYKYFGEVQPYFY